MLAVRLIPEGQNLANSDGRIQSDKVAWQAKNEEKEPSLISIGIGEVAGPIFQSNQERAMLQNVLNLAELAPTGGL